MARRAAESEEGETAPAMALDSLVAAAKLSDRYITARFLPDKAIDVIDEAGVLNRIEGGHQKRKIRVSDIERIVADLVGVGLDAGNACVDILADDLFGQSDDTVPDRAHHLPQGRLPQ